MYRGSLAPCITRCDTDCITTRDAPAAIGCAPLTQAPVVAVRRATRIVCPALPIVQAPPRTLEAILATHWQANSNHDDCCSLSMGREGIARGTDGARTGRTSGGDDLRARGARGAAARWAHCRRVHRSLPGVEPGASADRRECARLRAHQPPPRTLCSPSSLFVPSSCPRVHSRPRTISRNRRWAGESASSISSPITAP
jgi:hypothetical protein